MSGERWPKRVWRLYRKRAPLVHAPDSRRIGLATAPDDFEMLDRAEDAEGGG